MAEIPAQAVIDKLKEHIGELHAQIAIMQVQLDAQVTEGNPDAD